MNIRSRGFVAAMEDGETNIEMNIDDDIFVEVEAQSAEIIENSNLIHSELQSAQDAVADAETLDTIANTAEQSVEEGEGMDPVAAEIAEVAVESIYARLGISRRPMPSMESFGSAGSRKSATRIAVENWRETVKRVWDAVVKFFKNLWEKIKALFEKIIYFFYGLERAAKVIKKRVENLQGEPKEKEFENSILSNTLGRIPSSTINYDTAKAVIAFLELASSKTITLSIGLNAAILSIEGIKFASDYKEGDETTYKFKKMKEISDKIKKDIESYLDAIKDKNNVTGEKIESTNEVTESYNEINEAGYKIIQLPNIRIVKDENKIRSNKKIETLTKQQMIDICDHISRLAKEAKNVKEIIAATGNMLKNVSKLADAANEAIDKNNVRAKKAMKDVSRLVLKIGRFTSIASIFYSKLFTLVGKIVLKYVAESAKQYEKVS